MIAYRIGEGAKDHTGLAELVLEGGGHRDAVEHRIDRHARQPRAFMQRNAEFGVSLEQFRVHLIQALRLVERRARCRIIRDVLIIDRLVVYVRPRRLAHRLPVAECLEALVLLARDGGDHPLVESGRQAVRFDIGHEAVAVLLIDEGFHILSFA